MEEIWELKTFRKNLVLSNIITIFLTIYVKHGETINLWVAKIPMFNSIWNYAAIYGMNLFFLMRYCQYEMMSGVSVWENIFTARIFKNKKSKLTWVNVLTKKQYESTPQLSQFNAKNLFVDYKDNGLLWIIRPWMDVHLWNILSETNDSLIGIDTLILRPFNSKERKLQINICVKDPKSGTEVIHQLFYIVPICTLTKEKIIAAIKNKYIFDYEAPKWLFFISWIFVSLKLHNLI